MMLINGSGSIEGLTTGGLPLNSVTHGNMEKPVAGTAAFAVMKTNSASVGAAYNKVVFDVTDYNTGQWNAATSEFIADVDGFYHFELSLLFPSGAGEAIAALWKNDNEWRWANAATGARVVAQICGSFPLQAGDIVTPRAYCTSSVTMNGVTLGGRHTFSGYLVRAF